VETEKPKGRNSMKTKILGIAGSLRNARWGKGNRTLVDELLACKTEDELKQYLTDQAELHTQNFINAGRAEGLSFNEIYKNLQKLQGDKGLSNSEVALAVALWSAAQNGCEIEHISLSEYFPAAEVARNTDELKQHLRNADGILVSTPVYFGDRGSLAQELVDLIRNDTDLLSELRDKIYAGIAVGAKRNGGQETTLIYQLLDMVNVGLLGVGNDSDTTAQYGGTGHAGDVGTMAKDDYGLGTSMGTGRRIAHVAALVKLGKTTPLQGKVRVMFWVLQDKHDRALNYVKELVEQFDECIDATIIDVTEKYISRCIACDICPTHINVDQSYRCIMRTGNRDKMGELHHDFLNQDAIVPVVYSAADRQELISNYQRFIERTRYLRRGDYVFSDLLTAPLVLEDLGVNENMSIRMATSLLRHHTVVAEPMIAYLQHDELLNSRQVINKFGRFVARTQTLTAGRLRSFVNGQNCNVSKYNPVGYILSSEKDKEDEKLRARVKMIEERNASLAADAKLRLLGEEVSQKLVLQV
jgi:multimeric flavodoxin WrbA